MVRHILHYYHVWVKDYHWTDEKVPVQSPVLRLNKPGGPGPLPVFRPREGNNQNEPRIAATRDELSDGIGKSEYLTEAHGVFVPDKPRDPDKTRDPHIPLWVTYQQSSCATEGGVTRFVDLRSSTCSSAPISRIYWVPDYKSRDGKLYTIIGGKRRWQCERATVWTIMVCEQDEGAPQDAKITWISSDELSNLEQVDRFEKRRLFDIHWHLITNNCNAASPVMGSLFQIAKSEYSKDDGRPALNVQKRSHLTNQPRSDHESDLLEGGSDEGSSDGDTSQSTETSQPAPSDKCKSCLYPGLGPTFTDAYPDHYHGDDASCPRGSLHDKHCVRAKHAPLECVIPPSEPHVHCRDLYLSDKSKADLDAEQEHFKETDGYLPLVDSPYLSPESSRASPALPGSDTSMMESDPSPGPDHQYPAAEESTPGSCVDTWPPMDPEVQDLVF